MLTWEYFFKKNLIHLGHCKHLGLSPKPLKLLGLLPSISTDLGEPSHFCNSQTDKYMQYIISKQRNSTHFSSSTFIKQNHVYYIWKWSVPLKDANPMYSQAINTIRIQNGSFLTSMSLTGVEDRYYSFSFIQTLLLFHPPLSPKVTCVSQTKGQHWQTMRSNLQLVYLALCNFA